VETLHKIIALRDIFTFTTSSQVYW